MLLQLDRKEDPYSSPSIENPMQDRPHIVTHKSRKSEAFRSLSKCDSRDEALGCLIDSAASMDLCLHTLLVL